MHDEEKLATAAQSAMSTTTEIILANLTAELSQLSSEVAALHDQVERTKSALDVSWLLLGSTLIFFMQARRAT